MRLDREAGRHGDVARRADDLDDVVLLLGHLARLEQAREVDLGVRGKTRQLLELDQREDLVLVARARRAAHELRQPPVERRLAALEARAHGPARARLLAAHAEAARRALAGGDAAALAHFLLVAPGAGLMLSTLNSVAPTLASSAASRLFQSYSFICIAVCAGARTTAGAGPLLLTKAVARPAVAISASRAILE